MEQKTLHLLRLIVPGSLILIFAAIMGIALEIMSLKDLKLNEIVSGVVSIILGVIYRFSGLRNAVNRRHFERVNENIRSSLVRISGHIDDQDRFSWQRVRRVFYDVIDNDQSLKVLSGQAMFNGLFWTSAADLTALGSIFLGVSLFVVMVGFDQVIYASIVYFFCALAGVAGSFLTTRRQLALGDEQLELIKQKYRQEVHDKVGALA